MDAETANGLSGPVKVDAGDCQNLTISQTAKNKRRLPSDRPWVEAPQTPLIVPPCAVLLGGRLFLMIGMIVIAMRAAVEMGVDIAPVRLAGNLQLQGAV